MWKRELESLFLKEEMHKLGDPVIIAGCPTCRSTLQEHFPEVIGLWDVLKEIGLPEGSEKLQQTVMIHDACGARNDPDTQNSIREIVSRLGAEIKEGNWSMEKSACCGYGGLVSYVNKEVASEMAEECVKEDPQATYITYCMACRDRLKRQGSNAVHFSELVYGTAADDAPGLSQKRRNRKTLKEKLLKEVWKEEIMQEKPEFTYELSEEVRQKMEDRMILESDLLETLQAYRDNQMAVYNETDDTLTTRHRIGNVSFWVRFREENDHYTVLSVYSHRMTVRTR